MAAGKVIASEIPAATIRKLQRRLLPLLFLLYIVAFLDRINIGFAALTMNVDLAITSAQFGLLTGIFFWGYCLFEVPSNLLLHKLGARIWIARILVTWGLVAVLTGFVRSAPQLYLARFVLGVAEAGFFPGILLYLTYWFPQREQARVIALFMAAIPVSSILGAPLSGFILDHVRWLEIASWRWLLILEGLPAVICGIVTYFLLPGGPAEAGFLTAREKASITSALSQEESSKLGAHELSVWRVLTHRRVWHLGLIAFGYQTGSYTVYFWMPQGIASLSSLYSNTVVGVLVMIPHLAGLVSMILVARSSDHRMERRWHAAISLIASGVALLLLGAAHAPFLSIALWSLASMGVYSFLGAFWPLPSEFLAGILAASGIAMVNTIGSVGGFVGPYLVGAVAGGSGGMSRGLASVGVVLLAFAGLALLLPRKAPGSLEPRMLSS